MSVSKFGKFVWLCVALAIGPAIGICGTRVANAFLEDDYQEVLSRVKQRYGNEQIFNEPPLNSLKGFCGDPPAPFSNGELCDAYHAAGNAQTGATVGLVLTPVLPLMMGLSLATSWGSTTSI